MNQDNIGCCRGYAWISVTTTQAAPVTGEQRRPKTSGSRRQYVIEQVVAHVQHAIRLDASHAKYVGCHAKQMLTGLCPPGAPRPKLHLGPNSESVQFATQERGKQ
jgi:hypothetical protein